MNCWKRNNRLSTPAAACAAARMPDYCAYTGKNMSIWAEFKRLESSKTPENRCQLSRGRRKSAMLQRSQKYKNNSNKYKRNNGCSHQPYSGLFWRKMHTLRWPDNDLVKRVRPYAIWKIQNRFLMTEHWRYFLIFPVDISLTGQI